MRGYRTTTYFTPDEWPRVRAQLEMLGIHRYEHLRYDLNKPDLGWQPVKGSRAASAAKDNDTVNSDPPYEQKSLI